MLIPSYYHCLHNLPEYSTPLLQHGGLKVAASPRLYYLSSLLPVDPESSRIMESTLTGKLKCIKSQISATPRHCIFSLNFRGTLVVNPLVCKSEESGHPLVQFFRSSRS